MATRSGVPAVRRRAGGRAVLAASVVALVVSAVGAGDRAAARPTSERDHSDRPVVVADPAGSCGGLVGTVDASEIGLPTRGATVQSATMTPAVAGGNPEFCLVTGQILSVDTGAPPINFQLNLPTTWTRRTMQLGGGGFNGTVITGLGNVPGTAGAAAPVTPLRRNYATFGSDSGTAVGTNPPGSFGLNAESFANYSGDSVKKTRDTAQFLIRSYYGVAPRYEYYAGGSKGGHEGLVAAQRYAADYDGVIAYYPANQNPFLILGWDNLLRLAYDVPGGYLNPAKRQLVANAVVETCDGLDGATDGVIADTHGCDNTFHVEALECPGGADMGDDCLSATQVDTMRNAALPVDIDFTFPNGGSQTGPFPVLHGANLSIWLDDNGTGDSTIYNFFNTGVIRYWYLQNPAADRRRGRRFRLPRASGADHGDRRSVRRDRSQHRSVRQGWRQTADGPGDGRHAGPARSHQPLLREPRRPLRATPPTLCPLLHTARVRARQR